MAITSMSNYLQLRAALAERIATGSWKPDAVIGHEDDLAREFGVSPGIVRKVLDLMEHERLVTQRLGRGTFVKDQSSDELAVRFINIRNLTLERLVGDGKTAETTQGAANEMERTRLSLQRGDSVYRTRQYLLARLDAVINSLAIGVATGIAARGGIEFDLLMGVAGTLVSFACFEKLAS
jgi:DNA-binding GntR family transcriptional regulator